MNFVTEETLNSIDYRYVIECHSEEGQGVRLSRFSGHILIQVKYVTSTVMNILNCIICADKKFSYYRIVHYCWCHLQVYILDYGLVLVWQTLC